MKAPILACSLLALAACSQPAQQGGSAENRPTPSATAPANSAPASAELPRQRTGLWRVTANVPQVGPQTMDLCVTPDMVGQGPALSQQPMGDCTRPRFVREGDAWVGRSTCGSGESATETIMRTTGDFQTQMSSEVEVRAGGASVMRMTSTGTYVGPCPGA